MLVSHRYRFIYTKTIKTGGTSVESYFEPYCMADGEWTESQKRDEYISVPALSDTEAANARKIAGGGITCPQG